MLPGEAPGRGAPPARGAPGRGARGRGMGRSTGCAEENGLLPTRGVRGPGRGPGAPPVVGLGAGALAAGAGGCTGAGGADGAAGGAGAAGFGPAVSGGAVATPPAEAFGLAFEPVAAAPLPAALAVSGAGLAPPNASRNRRATGASTVDDADLTNSPCSLSRARTSLLVTPSSLANSCTRALPATTSPVWRRQRWEGRASGLAMTHGHRDFTVCSCSSLPVMLPGDAHFTMALKCSTTADVSGEPVMRNARPKARRRTAACRHCWSGCSHAPRPGRLPAGSTVTAHSPSPIDTATTRSSSTASSRLRHPMHVRTGPPMRRCVEAEVSRWITAQSTVIARALRTTHQARPASYRSWATSGPDWPSGWLGASLRMSMRQPVSRAASRAFCPSLPIASESWKSGTTTRAARAA